jgi:methylated-DNA-[protein]-cysteine S-methyltransferase
MLAQLKLKSKIGTLFLIASQNGLEGLYWNIQPIVMISKIQDPLLENILLDSSKQLIEYFGHKREAFHLKIHMNGSIFQKKVWSEIQKIKFGETITYSELAQRIDHPNAARAVGTAASKNPICIIVPCHRVVSKNHGIGNYSGGEKRKKYLLNLEEKEVRK